MVELARRSFLTGLGALLVAAPAIVRATSIMPVKQMILDRDWHRSWHELRYAGDGNFRYYSGYDVLHDRQINDLLEKRINAAQQVFAVNLRDSLDRIVYREGSGASDGLSALFNG